MNELKYLALGDSYTIGEAVATHERWTHLLVKKLNTKGINFDFPETIALTGWTTDELIEGINKKKSSCNFDMVSLLIGVNNQYRTYPIETYQKEFTLLLHSAIHFANNKKEKVFVVSIPDYGATPFGQEKEPSIIRKEVEIYNKVAGQICEKLDVIFINITEISKLAKGDNTMTASDGLHPSAKMYELWTDKIFPMIYQNLFF